MESLSSVKLIKDEKIGKIMDKLINNYKMHSISQFNNEQYKIQKHKEGLEYSEEV